MNLDSVTDNGHMVSHIIILMLSPDGYSLKSQGPVLILVIGIIQALRRMTRSITSTSRGGDASIPAWARA
jgi:hypothetical protein